MGMDERNWLHMYRADNSRTERERVAFLNCDILSHQTLCVKLHENIPDS